MNGKQIEPITVLTLEFVCSISVASRDSSLLTQTHKNCSSSVFAPLEGRVYYV
jgi:hypothetical protein